MNYRDFLVDNLENEGFLNEAKGSKPNPKKTKSNRNVTKSNSNNNCKDEDKKGFKKWSEFSDEDKQKLKKDAKVAGAILGGTALASVGINHIIKRQNKEYDDEALTKEEKKELKEAYEYLFENFSEVDVSILEILDEYDFMVLDEISEGYNRFED